MAKGLDWTGLRKLLMSIGLFEALFSGGFETYVCI